MTVNKDYISMYWSTYIFFQIKKKKNNNLKYFTQKVWDWEFS